jgi:serine/threonine protein phosphatase PrpC
MLFSPLNPRLGKKMLPTKKQRKTKMTTIIFSMFAGLGFIIFWLGFKLAPSVSNNIIEHTKSELPAFVRPQPHLLASHATLDQVNAYVNITKSTGSFNYQETETCKKYSSCEIHFPFLDLEDAAAIQLNGMLNAEKSHSDFAVLTKKGSKALVTSVRSNQDRSFLISPFEMAEETSIAAGKDDFLLGLFDGHGELGHGTAHFAAMELPPLLLRSMKRRKKYVSAKAADDVKAAFRESFVYLDENIPFLELSGSTGILMLRLGSYLFVASTGDSQAFVVRADTSKGDDGVSIVYLTTPHKPDQPMESTRIKASGGQIVPKMTDDTSSRVIIPVNDGMTLALAMSRSLGDAEGKKLGIIISDPNVDILDLNALRKDGGEYFVVAASDGLLDKIPPLSVAQNIARSFYKESPPQPLMACRALIHQASQLWVGGPVTYRDDITIIAKKIGQ